MSVITRYYKKVREMICDVRREWGSSIDGNILYARYHGLRFE